MKILEIDSKGFHAGVDFNVERSFAREEY